MSLFYDRLVENTGRFSEHQAILEGSVRWTYQDFLEQVDQAAAALTVWGVQPGERVGLMLYNQKEFLVLFFALRQIGAVVVPINIQMLPQDILHVIRNAGMRRLVVSDALFPHVRNTPLQCVVVGDSDSANYADFMQQGRTVGQKPVTKTAPDDLAFLLYTSGTTGYPKGVMLSEKNVLANIAGFSEMPSFSQTDRMVLALPLFHAYGLTVALTGLLAGGTIALVPKFHPKKIVEALIQEKATILPLVPTLFAVILDLIDRQSVADLSALRFCVSGGASLPAPLLARIETTLKAPVLEGYGLTETAPALTVNDPTHGSIPGCVGKPLHNVRIAILREDGSEAVTGEVGEVVAWGENVMAGYYQLPEDTRAVFTHDGGFRTGDLGHLDAEGRLYISGGRIKDLTIKGGENISPRPIEDVLHRHAAVREAAVIGVPHDKLGEEVIACVCLRDGTEVSREDLLRFCREHLTSSHAPGDIRNLRGLPKNATGKVIKKVLKEQIQVSV